MKMRRMILAGFTGVVLATGLAIALSACGSVAPSRAGRLLTMAAEEAGFIESLDERLTRQLNVADLQIQTGQKSEAVKTLGLAATTLKVVEKESDKKTLDDFRRIAGFASLAELYHRAGDNGAGTAAYYDAYEALKSVQPVAKRAEYVLSLSEVCAELKGKAEAARVLESGGQWAGEIKDQGSRRMALATFAQRLFEYDDFDKARVVMKVELDPRWRSDTLSAMARQAMEVKNRSGAYAAGMETARLRTAHEDRDSSKSVARESAGSEADAPQFLNNSVRYDFNYRRADIQQGIMPR